MLTTQCLAYSLAQQQRWQWQRQRRRWQQRQQQSAHPLRYSTFRPANRAALIQRAGSFPVRPQSTSARTCSDGGVMLLLLVKAAPAGKALGSEPQRIDAEIHDHKAAMHGTAVETKQESRQAGGMLWQAGRRAGRQADRQGTWERLWRTAATRPARDPGAGSLRGSETACSRGRGGIHETLDPQ